jgi:DNA-binding SARP family transcriptional activator
MREFERAKLGRRLQKALRARRASDNQRVIAGGDQAVASTLKIEILGGFAARQAGGEPIVLPKKSRALLAFLALNANRPQTRDKLASLLWEDSPEDQARASLRQTLSSLRRMGDNAILRADSDTITLETRGLDIDALAFERLAASEDPTDALEASRIYRGDLLDGLSFNESGFQSWLTAERERLRQLAREALRRTAEDALAARDAEGVLSAASRLTALDPLHEPAHRLLMRGFALVGRHAEALKQYRALQQLLRTELDVAPEPETVALYREISGQRRVGARGAGGFSAAAPLAAADDPAQAEEEESIASAEERVAPSTNKRRLAVLQIELVQAEDRDAETLHAEALAFVNTATEIVRAHGGVELPQGGGWLLAWFGDPIAHGDDVDRAARAALALHAALAAEGTSCRVGLAAGPVLVTDGPHGRLVVGEAVARAVRMARTADPGVTLIDSQLADELRGELGAMPARAAMPGALQVARRVARTAGATQRIMGRAAELGRLKALLEACRSGAGFAVCLRGDAGIGKTTLVGALLAHARENGFAVHGGRASDFGSTLDRSPVAQLVRSVSGAPADDQPSMSVPEMPLLDLLPSELIPAVWDLCRVQGEAARRAGIEPADHRARVAGQRAALEALVAAASAEAPLCLVAEDVHWAPEEELKWLAELSQIVSRQRVMLVLTARADQDPLDRAWRAAAGPLVTLDVLPLGDEDALALANSVAPMADDEARACVARAAGNPLFLTQLARSVAEGKHPEVALPGSVQSLTIARMDRLAGRDRRALQAAAILGQGFQIDALRFVLDDPSYVADALIEEALVLRAEDGLRFFHALTRDAVQATVMETQRRDWHLRAAEWHRTRSLELRAWHLDLARSGEAPGAYLEAARRALESYAHEDAVRLCRHGLDIGASVHRAELLMTRANAHFRMDELDAAASFARAALDLLDSPAERCAALLLESSALIQNDEADAAIARLDEAEKIALAADLPEVMAHLSSLRGKIHYPRGELEDCMTAHRTALVWAEKAGSVRHQAGALSGLALAFYQHGDFRAVEEHAGRCLELCGDRAFARIEAAAVLMRSHSRLFLLKHAGVESDAQHALELASSLRDPRTEMFARLTLGTACLDSLRLDEAIACAERARALAARVGGDRLEADSLWLMGSALGFEGRLADAADLLEQAFDLSMQADALRYAGPRHLGYLALFTEGERRREAYRRAEQILEKDCVAHAFLGFYGTAIGCAVEDREHALARRYGRCLAERSGGNDVPWVKFFVTMAETSGTGDTEVKSRLLAQVEAHPGLAWTRRFVDAL